MNLIDLKLILFAVLELVVVMFFFVKGILSKLELE